MLITKFKNLSKTKKITSSIIFITAFLCFLLINNLERTLSFVANKFFQINLKVENIDLSFNKIKVNNFKIYDKKNRLMIELPSIDFSYSLLRAKLEKLELNSPNIFLIKDEDGLNIKKVFEKEKTEEKNKKSKETEKDIEEKSEDYKAKSLAIENIIVSNLSINYELDKNNEIKEKSLKNINIEIESGKSKGIVAKLMTLDNYKENINILYNNLEEPLYLDLKLNNIYLEEYKDFFEDIEPKLKKFSGEIEANATISSKSGDGYIKVKNIETQYSDLETEIKADVNVKFDKQDVDILADYEIFGEKNQMEAMYKDGKLYSLLQFKNIDEKKLSKIVPLRESKIDLSKIDIEDIIFLIQYDRANGFKINFDLIPNNIEYGAIKLDKMRANLNIKDGIKTIDDSHIFLKIADMPTKLNLEAMIAEDNNKIDMTFQIQNLDKTSNLIPDFNSSLKIVNEEDKIKADFNSNIINFHSDYLKKEKDIKFYNDKFELIYNKENKKLKGFGELEFSIYGLKNYINYVIKEDEEKINFDQIKIENENNIKEYLDAKGYYDLANNDFNFEYDSTNLEIRRKYKGQDINFSFDGKGEFKRAHSVLTGLGNINGLNLSYLGDIKSLTGQYSLNVNEQNELGLEFNGKIEELDYGEFKIKDILIKLGFEKNILKIKQIGNEYFNINGKIDKATQNSNINFSINNLKNKDLSFDKFDFNVKDVKGNINGNLENPNINVDLKNIEIFIQENIAKLSGNIKMKNKEVNISELKLNKNKLTGKYNLDNKKYNIDFVVEDNLSNYIKDVDYKLNGLLKIRGLDGKLTSNFNLKGNGKLKDTILPNLKLSANYSAKNYSDGVVKVETLSLENANDKKIVNLKGNINLKNKNLNLISNENISLNDLQEYIKNNDLQGKFDLNISLMGKLDNPEYNLNLDSKEISLKDFRLNNLNSKLIGDKKSLNIENLSFEFLNNKFIGNGKYNIQNKDYDFRFKSSEIIKISSLNSLFEKSDIKELNGLMDINLVFNKNGLNGYFKADNINLKDKKNYLDINNLNIDVLLENNEIKTKDFSGKINNGDLKVEAYAKIPKDFKDIADSLVYYFNLDAQNIEYDNPEVAKISINSQLKVNNKEIDGNIIVNNGHIYDIPNDYKTFWSIIKNKVLNKEDKDKKKKEDSQTITKNKDVEKKKYEKILKKWDKIKIKLLTREPVILDIDDFNIVVGELKGKLVTDLELSGTDGKLNLLGHTEILNGYLYVNTNKFTLDRALVSFNDRRNYLPEINPDIFIETRVTMDDEEISFNINGRPKKLIYSLSSDSGNIRGDFNSLLINSQNEFNFDGDMNRVYVNFMKNIIAGQIMQTVFSPITKSAKKILKLSKLQIKPEVSVYNVDSRTNQANNLGRNLEVYDFGARLEAEKKICSDKLYLYGNAKLFGSEKDPIINSSLEKYGVRDYDVGLEYRTKDDKTFGVGVGTVSDRYVNEGRNQKKRNYHVDFKIRKKYDNLWEIFSF